MEYGEAVSYIHSHFIGGSKNGFENISRLLAEYGSPQERLKFIHIAGTNGKGSATAMCASMLRSAGYRVGMYISPYVIRFNERVQVDGEMIPDKDLAALVTEMSGAVDRLFAPGKMMTEFEFITALAMVYFDRRGCDIVCLEVGMGGMADPTNVIPCPLVSVIMSISLDHTKVLGDTVEQIAAVKCGIIKRGGVTVCYPRQEPGVLAVVMERCGEQGSRLVMPGAASVEVRRETVFGSEFRYRRLDISLPLGGRHQVDNAITAIEAMLALRGQGFSLPDEAIVKGLAEVRFPARQEVLGREPLVVVDGAHNASGAQSLAKTLRHLAERPLVGIVGVLSSKDYAAVLQATAPCFDCLFAVKAQDKPGTEGLGPETLAEAARGLCPKVALCGSEREALEQAREAAGKAGAVVIYGSLYLASTMREILLEKE